MEFSPVPGLESCGKILLQIWDTMQQVAVSPLSTSVTKHGPLTLDNNRMIQLNRMRCLRLTMRAADLMISIRGEIARLNDATGKELRHPLNTFEECVLIHISPTMPL